ncbi:MAG: acylphosphatase [Bacteroidota bacterium]|jgi:acylphosphatase
MSLIHYNITVKGKVQGVAYRFNAQAQATRYDLNGFVKNLPNGDVYIEAEGEEDNVNNFISWCQIGPRLAEVSEVIAELGEVRQFSSFELKR